MKVGDMTKFGWRGAHFYGLILELLASDDPITGENIMTALIWRPELPTSQQYQTWVCNDNGEVVYEGR